MPNLGGLRQHLSCYAIFNGVENGANDPAALKEVNLPRVSDWDQGLVDFATSLALKGAVLAQHEIRCCRGSQSTDAHSTLH
jgi:hypothetical protein